MSSTMALLEASMRADAEALRVTGHNIANADVTGFRRQISVNSVDSTSFVDAETAASARMQAQPGLVPTSHVATDVRPGTLKSTGRALDVAIEGAGYLLLQAAQGQLLTRRGDLQISPQGLLTAASGAPVLGEQGVIDVSGGTPSIDLDGTVRVDGQIVDRLKVVEALDEATLQYLGNGEFSATGDVIPSEHSMLRQGFLEASNVAPVGEMVQMMETMRHFEAGQRFVRGYDQMLEQAISELGKIG